MLTLLNVGSILRLAFLTQVMENLQNLTNLQELWLGRNRIKAVNLCGLKCIKKISLQSNRLTSMKGLEVRLLDVVRFLLSGCKTISLIEQILLLHD